MAFSLVSFTSFHTTSQSALMANNKVASIFSGEFRLVALLFFPLLINIFFSNCLIYYVPIYSLIYYMDLFQLQTWQGTQPVFATIYGCILYAHLYVLVSLPCSKHEQKTFFLQKKNLFLDPCNCAANSVNRNTPSQSPLVFSSLVVPKEFYILP